MPSVVTICNIALGHIGDIANVSSVFPPDASPQAGYCNKFYPLALAAALEMAAWGFATRRIALAEASSNPSKTWRHAYAYPDAVVKLLSVLPIDALDDYSANFGDRDRCGDPYRYSEPDFANPAENFYMPQPYSVETDSSGNMLILTNVRRAVLRYTTLVTDPNKFSALFVLALSYLLASMLAGPIIKGDAGTEKANEMLQKYQAFEAQASASDANQRKTEVRQSVPWMAHR
jgi:hypothetical protein